MSIQVVVSKFKENIDWVKKCPYDIIVYSKLKDEPNFVPHGTDTEASSYIRYIIDNYDDLKDWTYFVHGHEWHWHHPMSILKSFEIDISALSNECKFFSINHGSWHFRQLRTKYTDYHLQHKTLPIMVYKNSNPMPSELTLEEYSEVTKEIFGEKEFNAIMSKYFSHSKNITQQFYPASAQFCVHKSRILARPKSFYEACYCVFEDMSDETLLSKNRLSQLLSKKAKAECYKNRTISGFFFEANWHYIFGEDFFYRPIYTNYNNYPFINS